MEESKTKIIENSWLLFGLQAVFVLILFKFNYLQLSINLDIVHAIEVFLIIFSLYSIIIAIKTLIQEGKKASGGYFLLIFSSIVLLLFSYFILPFMFWFRW